MLILSVGLLSAAVVYRLASTNSEDQNTAYSMVGGQSFGLSAQEQARALYELKRIGGTQAVLTVELHTWLKSLWHGKRLAISLAAVSLLMGGLCFHLGSLADEDPEA